MLRQFIVPLTLILLAGCSQTVETRIMSKGQPASIAGTFSLSETTSLSPGLLSARKLVSEALLSRGYTIAENGAFHLEVSLAERPAELSLGSAAGPTSIAVAKRKKPLQSCQDREYRIGVALTRVTDGALLFQSSAAEYHCNQPIADSLPELVKAALADLGNPRGTYTVKRAGRD